MANYDRLKKCKCNGCPLSVDVVTARDGNGVCEFHHAAKAVDWMAVRDRIVLHQEFLVVAQHIGRLALRYRPTADVNAWVLGVKADLKKDILSIKPSVSRAGAFDALKQILG